MKKYSAVIAGLFLIACTSTKKTTVAQTKAVTPAQTAAPVQPVAAQLAHKVYSREQLNRGKELYSQHCAECHNLKSPTSLTSEQWKIIVPPMVAKVNKKHPNTVDETTKDLLLNYLITMSTPESDRQ